MLAQVQSTVLEQPEDRWRSSNDRRSSCVIEEEACSHTVGSPKMGALNNSFQVHIGQVELGSCMGLPFLGILVRPHVR